MSNPMSPAAVVRAVVDGVSRLVVVRVRDGETIAFARTFGHVDELVTAVTADRRPAPPG